VKYAVGLGFGKEILETSDGHVTLRFSGQGVYSAFKHEAGKHCVQRIPPTEHNGRKQTSMVSVMVLPLPPEKSLAPIPSHELDIKCQKGSGPGGQKVNKSSSAVRIVHLPTKLSVLINGRSQYQNKAEALRIITARVHQMRSEQQSGEYGSIRKDQWGGGGRGNKCRTYNFLESRAVDHRFNIKTSKVMDVIEKGRFDLLHPPNG